MEIVQRRGGLVKFQQGNITNQYVDAIINFVYSKGRVRDLDGILAAAGASVVTEYEKECSKDNRLVRRGVVVTTAGNLPNKKIFHCIVNDRPEKMKDALCVALRQADREEMTHVAIPQLRFDMFGGNDRAFAEIDRFGDQNITLSLASILGIPKTTLGIEYLQMIMDFEKAENPTCLRLIKVLIHASSIEVKERRERSDLRGFGEAGITYNPRQVCHHINIHCIDRNCTFRGRGAWVGDVAHGCKP